MRRAARAGLAWQALGLDSSVGVAEALGVAKTFRVPAVDGLVGREAELYPAFGRGDVPAILDQLTHDVICYDPGSPEVSHAAQEPIASASGPIATASTDAARHEFSAADSCPPTTRETPSSAR